MENLIIQKLKELVQELNRTPTGVEFYKMSGYSKRTVTKLFETYNKLLEKADIKQIRVTEKFTIHCKQCNKVLLLPKYRLSNNNFCSQTCANIFNNPNPKKDRESCCDNCQKTFNKTKDQVSNTCSQFCLMELGMKQRLMKDSVKRKRS